MMEWWNDARLGRANRKAHRAWRIAKRQDRSAGMLEWWEDQRDTGIMEWWNDGMLGRSKMQDAGSRMPA
ncbi:MAG: hypothetical protein CVU57_12690 [Deltaproteobacteria bacterium HGW-Deltaproteobacteria-15]|jgi:hypothetical protein|nr:MAG: hypothetical protein CVU57_12690 [Deltaproteobacteria bacterium HGW-Deltaproteobacteria-15]